MSLITPLLLVSSVALARVPVSSSWLTWGLPTGPGVKSPVWRQEETGTDACEAAGAQQLAAGRDAVPCQATAWIALEPACLPRS